MYLLAPEDGMALLARIVTRAASSVCGCQMDSGETPGEEAGSVKSVYAGWLGECCHGMRRWFLSCSMTHLKLQRLYPRLTS